MITHKIKKLKKYLFFISIIFFVLTSIHLTYSYLYTNSKSLPVKWGVISEWIIWKVPSLNPLLPLYSDGNEKYVIELLYRSILKYDIDKKKIVWDIANCDISSLINIQCIINEDAKWSNWEAITSEDILSTYQLIKEAKTNNTLNSLLNDTEIESKDNVIIFKNKRKDVNFLNVFFQPILNKGFIDTLDTKSITWNFPITWWIYSWKFMIDKASEDESIGIKRLTFIKNPYFDRWNISKIILNIFPDINSFKKNNQAVNIFNDSENNIWNSLSRFDNYYYKINSFNGLFLNKNKITNQNLRTYILNKIDSEKLVKVLWEKNYEVIKNPFLGEKSIWKEPENKNFDAVMAAIWYKKKSAFMDSLIPEKEKIITSWDQNIKTEEKTQKMVIPEDLSIDRYQQDSKTIISPEYVDLYNFVTKDDILLTWKNPWNVEAVYVNDYKLANFKSGDEKFYYRLKESIWTLKAWTNTYKIYFEIWGKKELQEEIIFIYYHDKSVLEKAKKDLAISIFKKKWEEENKKVEVKEEPKKEEKVEKKPEENIKNKELFDKINKLDEKFYYDKNLKEFTLVLFYLNDSKKETADTVEFIKNSMEEIWIKIDAKPFEFKDLSSIMAEKNKYDMILAGIHLWYLDSNLFPYFHSSQVKTGFNFSSLRKTSLDLLLEELKENILTDERKETLKNKILEILENEQVLKTLYTPKINLLVDSNNIKIDKKYEFLPYKSERSSILESLYIKEEKVLTLKWKSLSGFFKFLAKKIYE